MEYLIRLAQVHETFRWPELESLANVEGISLDLVEYSTESPFCIVRVESQEAARKLIQRSILSHAIYELWGHGRNYDALHADVHRRKSSAWNQYRHDSFRFSIECFQGSRTQPEQREIIESFSYLGFEGPILMKGADHEFCIHENYESNGKFPSMIYLGRLTGRSGRNAINKYDLKKRSYINTTSMDSELALITANLALVSPGKFCYDPFVGTASFPIACAHFGAMTFGSDMDGRTIRGTNRRNILTNFEQYGLRSHWLDGFTADVTNSPLRWSRCLDAILCDPPYGVREALKVLGRKDGGGKEAIYIDGVAAHTLPGYIPPKMQYSFDALLDDILDFASSTLIDKGRLCMWMPTANDQAFELPIPQHPALQVVFTCVQNFNKWSRRLLVYTRLPDEEVRDLRSHSKREYAYGKTADDLNPFRRKFFTGFKEKS